MRRSKSWKATAFPDTNREFPRKTLNALRDKACARWLLFTTLRVGPKGVGSLAGRHLRFRMRPHQAVRPHRPLWLVEGRRIVELTAEMAAIEISGGKRLSYRRKPYLDLEAIAVWDVVSER